MRIHHLNAISTCPLGGRLMDGRTESIVRRGHLTCHCLLIETDSSLVLVDTGMGLRDVRDPKSRLSAFFLALVSPDFREEMTAVQQIRRLGFDPRDVRHIVLTHLDFDHAGGLDDFPGATVHMLESERAAATAQRTWLDRQRFRPQQWSTQPHWLGYAADGGERWFGFERVRALQGLPPEIIMVPLLGHTLGHAGVAVKRDDGRWLLQASDAYFFHAEMHATPRCTPGLRFYQWMMEKDRRARLENQQRLRELRRDHASEVEVFCAHDVLEFERLSGRSAELPAEAMVRSASTDRPSRARTSIVSEDRGESRPR
jgi:glyoxylase-like metal-dependent hydrolase (beta-lactamase superfamily II)